MLLKKGFGVLTFNVGANFVSQVFLLGLFLVTTPYVIRGLGTEPYGVLSLVMIIVAYVGMLDLGISPASLKYLSEHLARNELDDARRVASSAATADFVLGAVGGGFIAAFAPVLVHNFFRVPAPLQQQAVWALYLFAFSAPFGMMQNALQGIPAGLQRFGLINLIGGVTGTLQAVSAVVLVSLHCSLVHVAMAYAAIKTLTALTFLGVALKLLPGLRLRLSWDGDVVAKLLRFGRWIVISSVVGPILVYCDRFLVGALLSAAAVTYYSVPYAVANRLQVIPASLSPVLFPAFSAQAATLDMVALSRTFRKALAVLLLVMAPVVLILAAVADPVLRIWLGSEFATEGAPALRLLAVGVLFNALAAIPLTVLWSLNRPDAPAKLHLIELPLYVALCAFFIQALGVTGAALAWLIRVAVDFGLLYWTARRAIGRGRTDVLVPGDRVASETGTSRELSSLSPSSAGDVANT